MNNDATLVPPRFLLDEITRGRFINKSSGEKMEETNLKPLMTRSGHPWYLGDEPTVVITAESTNSFDPKLGQLNDDLSWKYRCGSKYILCEATADEAWEIIFKCIISSVMSAIAIDQISSHLEGHLLKHGSVLPAPGSHHCPCSLIRSPNMSGASAFCTTTLGLWLRIQGI